MVGVGEVPVSQALNAGRLVSECGAPAVEQAHFLVFVMFGRIEMHDMRVTERATVLRDRKDVGRHEGLGRRQD
ncbi:MAG: hypothetical protein DCO97_17100 [Marivita sp. XM-24bin2]|jgi:hypothetical protein|nr:MAG: hypothetical protein DCO97_17100 [Marivita sp. XM-24bin2]